MINLKRGKGPEIHIKKGINKPVNKKINIIPSNKIRKLIVLSGILDKIPVTANVFFIVSLAIELILIIAGFIDFNIIPAAIFLILEYLILLKLQNNRLQNVYLQLEKFIHRCCDLGYTDITEIFGSIYQDFNGAFSKDLANCYMEAKKTGNKEQAVQTLKNKYDIEYLNFCIDTLQMIKQNSKEVTVSTEFLCRQTKNKVKLVETTVNKMNNAKADVALSCVLCIGIMSVTGYIFNASLIGFLSTKTGIVFFIIFILLFIHILSMFYKE